MKTNILTILLVTGVMTGFSQSKSFQTLESKFADKEDVHTFRLSGFVCRTALSIFAPQEKTFRTLIKDVHQVRFMVIPKTAFVNQALSVNGFKEVLRRDSFSALATVRDHGADISFFHRMDDNKKNRYFVLVEEKDEVVAIEMKGSIDPGLLMKQDLRTSLNR